MQKTIYIQKIFLLIVVTFSYSIAMAQQFKSPDVIPSSPQSQLIENFYEKGCLGGRTLPFFQRACVINISSV